MPSTAPGGGSRRVILAVAISAIALETSLLGLVAPLLPEIEERTGAGDAALGLALAAYAIPILLISIPVGRLADRIGRRPLLLTGLVLTGRRLAADRLLPLARALPDRAGGAGNRLHRQLGGRALHRLRSRPARSQGRGDRLRARRQQRRRDRRTRVGRGGRRADLLRGPVPPGDRTLRGDVRGGLPRPAARPARPRRRLRRRGRRHQDPAAAGRPRPGVGHRRRCLVPRRRRFRGPARSRPAARHGGDRDRPDVRGRGGPRRGRRSACRARGRSPRTPRRRHLRRRGGGGLRHPAHRSRHAWRERPSRSSSSASARRSSSPVPSPGSRRRSPGSTAASLTAASTSPTRSATRWDRWPPGEPLDIASADAVYMGMTAICVVGAGWLAMRPGHRGAGVIRQSG